MTEYEWCMKYEQNYVWFVAFLSTIWQSCHGYSHDLNIRKLVNSSIQMAHLLLLTALLMGSTQFFCAKTKRMLSIHVLYTWTGRQLEILKPMFHNWQMEFSISFHSVAKSLLPVTERWIQRLSGTSDKR